MGSGLRQGIGVSPLVHEKQVSNYPLETSEERRGSIVGEWVQKLIRSL